VDEVAAVAVDAKLLVFEAAALLGLILGVELVVSAQLLRAVGELAPLLVGTVPVLHESLAQLRLLLAPAHLERFISRFVRRVRGRLLVRPGGGEVRVRAGGGGEALRDSAKHGRTRGMIIIRTPSITIYWGYMNGSQYLCLGDLWQEGGRAAGRQ
jgi:hypothetical protein